MAVGEGQDQFSLVLQLVVVVGGLAGPLCIALSLLPWVVIGATNFNKDCRFSRATDLGIFGRSPGPDDAMALGGSAGPSDLCASGRGIAIGY